MGILSGFTKVKRYVKQDDGHKLLSQWTSSETVERADGTTVEEAITDIENSTVVLTQEEYDNLPDTKLTDGVTYYISDGAGDPSHVSAYSTSYNNKRSGLSATSVQSAIDELASEVDELASEVDAVPEFIVGTSEPTASIGKDGDIYIMKI